MNESLRMAAREGNVSDLYKLIQRDGNVLRRIDEVEFIETPLHTAADAGCIDFAMEIMSLKPTFARKLNHEGLSPIHIAVGKGHTELVLNLIQNAKDLVRIKGKKGETPLHYVINRKENSELPDLLLRFLKDCPESIRDVTTETQSALHIAVRNNKEEALKILCKVLRKTEYCHDLVNQKDRNGDTALHLAARDNRHEMIKLLLKCKADKHVTNQAGSTPLEVAQQYDNRESISILGSRFIPRVSILIYKSQKQIVKHVTKASSTIFHDMDNISSEDRNALLVILALLLTVTYQAGLSPPGSVWQGDGSSNSNFIKRTSEKIPGKSVINEATFLLFYIPTTAVFIVSSFLTFGLLKPFPRGFRCALQILLSFLAMSFTAAMGILVPTKFAYDALRSFNAIVFVLMMFMCVAYRVSKFCVVILGCWLYPLYFMITGDVILGCLLFLFLYDEFWKGSVLVVGCCLILGLGFDEANPEEPIIILGCWLILSLCRFFVKRYKERCYSF